MFAYDIKFDNWSFIVRKSNEQTVQLPGRCQKFSKFKFKRLWQQNKTKYQVKIILHNNPSMKHQSSSLWKSVSTIFGKCHQRRCAFQKLPEIQRSKLRRIYTIGIFELLYEFQCLNCVLRLLFFQSLISDKFRRRQLFWNFTKRFMQTKTAFSSNRASKLNRSPILKLNIWIFYLSTWLSIWWTVWSMMRFVNCLGKLWKFWLRLSSWNIWLSAFSLELLELPIVAPYSC